MKILFCSGEAHPFSKSGGLADVSYALSKALLKKGHDIKIITPLYQNLISKKDTFKHIGEAKIKVGNQYETAVYYITTYDGLSYVFVDHEKFFNKSKYYGYSDDALRFTFFNLAILEYIKLTKNYPNIIHANDWQTSLVPFFLDVFYRRLDSSFKDIKTLLSIHNLEKQGAFPMDIESLFNHKNFTYIHMNQVNFLKCGIMRANAINTVSENYKDEILTRFYGFSLDGPLKSRQYDLYGILNGFDDELYNPKNNKNIYQGYDEETHTIGKKINRKELIKFFNLKPDLDIPIVSFIHRFARQKGLDIIMEVLEDYLKIGAFYFIAIGSGDALYESYFMKLQKKYPEYVYYKEGFDVNLEQKVYASSDLFMLPSLFEPCGLNHMIAMKYGALPIVRETGGLKDTVTPYNKFSGIGVGFTFKNYNKSEFIEAIDQSLELYHEDKEAFNSMVHQAMHIKYSVSKMASQYEDLYNKILNG
jgi:starch synthase